MNNFIQEYIVTFPEAWKFQIDDRLDRAVEGFALEHQEILSMIKRSIINFVGFIKNGLIAIPWIFIVLFVGFLAWYLTKKISKSIIYGLLLCFVGCCGFWIQMLETLSIVITSVILCIVMGFPLGILIAMNKRANAIIRPILDTMQTMPSWVYLVPAVMLFYVGVTPALIATTIYAIVPMIRMSSHGLLHIDEEMLEASKSFGATRMQTLIKVQIPLAMPMIMTGVNQTIMMAMSMVVTCALIGANGLGMEILIATNRLEMGKSLLPGICIVIVAVILDRLTQNTVAAQKEYEDE